MAASIKRIRDVKQQLPPLQYGSDALNVFYYKNAYTPRLEEASSRANTSQSAGELLTMLALPVIASWDLTNEYEVYKYERSMVVDADFKPLPGRLFVVNAEAGDSTAGGKLGEWDQYVIREEMVDAGTNGDEPTLVKVLFELTPVYENGEVKVVTKGVPVTEQGLLDVPLNVLTDIIKAIGEELTPGETKSTNSEGSFS